MLSLPNLWEASILVILFVLLIGFSTWIISDKCQIVHICYVVASMVFFGLVAFLIYIIHKDHVWWLITTGIFFVVISALVFSFYFETIELMFDVRGFRNLGWRGGGLIFLCVAGLIGFKLIITKLKGND